MSEDNFRRRCEATLNRLHRLRGKRDVEMVAPDVGQALVEQGRVVLADPQEFDNGDPKFQYDPRYHMPVRLKLVVVD